MKKILISNKNYNSRKKEKENIKQIASYTNMYINLGEDVYKSFYHVIFLCRKKMCF